MSNLAIDIRNVVKRFDQHVAVRDLSLQVPRGTVYGLLGPNGAGKTTTIRMILSIIEPDSGTIGIFGRGHAELGVTDPRALRLMRESIMNWQMIGMLVGEQHGMHHPHPFAEQLRPQIGGRVHQQVVLETEPAAMLSVAENVTVADTPVVALADRTPPVLTLPANITQDATGGRRRGTSSAILERDRVRQRRDVDLAHVHDGGGVALGGAIEAIARDLARQQAADGEGGHVLAQLALPDGQLAGRRGLDKAGSAFITYDPTFDDPNTVRAIVQGEVEPVVVPPAPQPTGQK